MRFIWGLYCFMKQRPRVLSSYHEPVVNFENKIALSPQQSLCDSVHKVSVCSLHVWMYYLRNKTSQYILYVLNTWKTNHALSAFTTMRRKCRTTCFNKSNQCLTPLWRCRFCSWLGLLYWHCSLITRDMLQDGLQPVKNSEVISLGGDPDGKRPGQKKKKNPPQLINQSLFFFRPSDG